MSNKIVRVLCAIAVSIFFLLGCDSRYVYTDTDIDILCDGYDRNGQPSPVSDEDYMLYRLQNTSFIAEGVIVGDLTLWEGGQEMAALISITEVWYGKAPGSKIDVLLPFRWLDIENGSCAPKTGDHIVMFLARAPGVSIQEDVPSPRTKEGYYLLAKTYETAFIINPSDEKLIPLRTSENSSSLAGGTKEELRKAVKDTLDGIANGTLDPKQPSPYALDLLIDKYVKKYERKQKWLSLFPWLKNNGILG